MFYDLKIKLTKDIANDFAIFCTLNNKNTNDTSCLQYDYDELYTMLINNITSSLIAAKALDELKHKCTREQKMLLLKKVIDSDKLCYIIENTAFDNYIIKEIINSNPSKEVLLSIIKRYVRMEKDIYKFINKKDADDLKSLYILTKLEGEDKK